MEIGELSPDEWQEFRRVRLEALKAEPNALAAFQKKDRSEPEWTREDWQDRVRLLSGENSPLRCMAARDRGRIIGMLGYGKVFSEPGAAFLWGMYVNKDYRGKGVGETLLKDALNTLKNDKKYKRVILVVSAGNTDVIDFYEKNGFHLAEVRQDEPKDGEMTETYVMAKDLGSDEDPEEDQEVGN